MMTLPGFRGLGALLIVSCAALAAGCSADALPTDNGELGSRRPDQLSSENADGVSPGEDLAATANECGDQEATCLDLVVGAPFPLRSDAQPTPGEDDQGLKRDFNGYLVF